MELNMATVDQLQRFSDTATTGSSPEHTILISTAVEAPTPDKNHVSSLGAATQSTSSMPQDQATTPKPSRTFREKFCRLPPEIRCMIYEFLVAHRVIDFLKDSNFNLGTDAVLQLVTCEQNQPASTSLGVDIKTWIQFRKDLIFDPEIGLFEPETALFSGTFTHIPYKKGNGNRRTMDELSLKDAIAWDRFSSSDFHVLNVNVRQIRLDLHRHTIFTGHQNCLEGFKTDLRSIANFRSLERIDIHCDTHMYLHEEWQDMEDEPEWSNVHADAQLRRIWRNFWRYGGWCHPGRACTCCVLPEIRLRGYGTEWQLLDFEPEIPESSLEETIAYDRQMTTQRAQWFERRFGRNLASIRQWLQSEIGRCKYIHRFNASRRTWNEERNRKRESLYDEMMREREESQKNGSARWSFTGIGPWTGIDYSQKQG